MTQNRMSPQVSELNKQALFLQAKSSLIELCLSKVCVFLSLQNSPIVQCV
jgi:hypothetical protein